MFSQVNVGKLTHGRKHGMTDIMICASDIERETIEKR